jgi:hypothetical protein
MNAAHAVHLILQSRGVPSFDDQSDDETSARSSASLPSIEPDDILRANANADSATIVAAAVQLDPAVLRQQIAALPFDVFGLDPETVTSPEDLLDDSTAQSHFTYREMYRVLSSVKCSILVDFN